YWTFFGFLCDLLTIASFLVFNRTSTAYFSTLSLHDALPIFGQVGRGVVHHHPQCRVGGRDVQPLIVQRLLQLTGQPGAVLEEVEDRKSTRLNSSHVKISYAVFCLKKKKHK